MDLTDGYLVVVKADCPTCVEIVPALRELSESGLPFLVASQDDSAFPAQMEVIDDRDLELSWRLAIEITPTIVEIDGGAPGRRIAGWDRGKWEELLGTRILTAAVPEWRPGCGSLTQLPDMARRLAARFDGGSTLDSRHIELGELEDEHEALFARGWTDGLPAVPPTPERVTNMLSGTDRLPSDTIALLAPDYAACTIEKAAVNAVMAGCLPDYLPVVIAAVEAVASEDFNLHGVAATTWYSGPIIIVNGPVAQRIGMNATFNAFGPGNRANATIGRALNLIIRNIGGSRPGGVDRSTQGHPAKYTMAFAEREKDSPWPSLAEERGIAPGRSAVTLFAGQGPTPVSDQRSRDPESLARSLAGSLRAVHNVSAFGAIAALLAISPEHGAVFAAAGWSKARLRAELVSLLTVPAEELAEFRGRNKVGQTDAFATGRIAKFAPEDLWFAHVGSAAGGNTGIFSGWIAGSGGSSMVTIPIEEKTS